MVGNPMDTSRIRENDAGVHLGGMARRARASWHRSPRVRVARMLWQGSPGVAAGLLGCAVVAGVAPFLVLASMGWTAGRVPPAVRNGMGSPAGIRLLVALVRSSLRQITTYPHLTQPRGHG